MWCQDVRVNIRMQGNMMTHGQSQPRKGLVSPHSEAGIFWRCAHEFQRIIASKPRPRMLLPVFVVSNRWKEISTGPTWWRQFDISTARSAVLPRPHLRATYSISCTALLRENCCAQYWHIHCSINSPPLPLWCTHMHHTNSRVSTTIQMYALYCSKLPFIPPLDWSCRGSYYSNQV